MKNNEIRLLPLMIAPLLANPLLIESAFAGKPSTSDKKVDICHLPPGNPANGQNLSISENAWKTGGAPGKHREGGHGGDYLGTCITGTDTTEPTEPTDTPDDSEKKVDICHRPPGNPENGQNLSISENAWKTGGAPGKHREGGHGGDSLGTCSPYITICDIDGSEVGGSITKRISFSEWMDKYKDNVDYLGSCHTVKTVEEVLVIKDCKGVYRKTLITLTQSYYDPIIINDDAYDDEATVVALSECLDHGDGSDSGKGKGYDNISDSGNHHRISSCLNIDSSDSSGADSSKNYRKKLEQKKRHFDLSKGHGDSSLNISDSSMDDSDVYNEYKKCAESDASNKGDLGKGDSGYKYREMKNCPNAADIKSAIEAYREKVADPDSTNIYARRPIVIKNSTLQDRRIREAVDNCINPWFGGGFPVTMPGGTTGFLGRLNWKEKVNN